MPPASAPRSPVSKSTGPAADRARLLADLKERVRRIEGIGGADGTAVVPLGVPDLDAHLPGGGLALGAVHEVIGPAGDLDSGAATAFAAVILAKLSAERGPVLWICRGRDLYAPGLAGFGLAPERLILVQAGGRGRQAEADILWAMEEALRTPQVGAVLAEAGELDLAMSRRLQLAAEAGGVPGLLLRLKPRRVEASAAVTRWSVTALPRSAFAPAGLDGQPLDATAWSAPSELHHPAWRVELNRVRGGRPGIWHLAWRNLGAFAGLQGGPAPAETGQGGAAGQGVGVDDVLQLPLGRRAG